jgi:protein TonB
MLLKPSANDDQKNPSISVRLFKPAPPVIKPPIKVTKQTSNMVTRKILNKLKQNQAQKQSLDVYEKVSRLNAAKIKKKQKQPKKPPAKSIKKIRKTPSKPKPVKKLTIKPEPPPTQPEKPTEIHEPDNYPEPEQILNQNAVVSPQNIIETPDYPEDKKKNINESNTITPKPVITDFTEYLEQIRLIIGKAKKFPRQARRRNIQGQVNLRFSINSNGKAQNLKVMNQPHKLLLNAAKNLIEKTNFPAPPKGWQESFEIEIPIMYRVRKLRQRYQER